MFLARSWRVGGRGARATPPASRLATAREYAAALAGRKGALKTRKLLLGTLNAWDELWVTTSGSGGDGGAPPARHPVAVELEKQIARDEARSYQNQLDQL